MLLLGQHGKGREGGRCPRREKWDGRCQGHGRSGTGRCYSCGITWSKARRPWPGSHVQGAEGSAWTLSPVWLHDSELSSIPPGPFSSSCPCIHQRVGEESRGPEKVGCLYPGSQWGVSLDRYTSTPPALTPSHQATALPPHTGPGAREPYLSSSPTLFPAAGDSSSFAPALPPPGAPHSSQLPALLGAHSREPEGHRSGGAALAEARVMAPGSDFQAVGNGPPLLRRVRLSLKRPW